MFATERDAAIANFDGSIDLIDVTTGALKGRCRGHTARVRAIVPLDETSFLTASDDRTLRRWDLQTATETSRLTGHVGWVRSRSRLLTTEWFPEVRTELSDAGTWLTLVPLRADTLGGYGGWLRRVTLSQAPPRMGPFAFGPQAWVQHWRPRWSRSQPCTPSRSMGDA